MIVLIT